jgi:hypothetical protein
MKMKKPTFFGWYILVVFVLMCLMALLVSCRTQYVPVETVRTEYINRTDTVHKTDTVTNERETVIREVNKGDSALLAKYGIQIKDNERMLLFLQRELDKERSKEREVQHDTVVANDTIRVPYPVEREASLSERLGEKVFYLLILAVLLYFIFRRQK